MPPKTPEEKAAVVDRVTAAFRAYTEATKAKNEADVALRAALRAEAKALETLQKERAQLKKDTEGEE